MSQRTYIYVNISRMSLSHQTSRQSQAFLRIEASLHVLILHFEAPSPNPPWGHILHLSFCGSRSCVAFQACLQMTPAYRSPLTRADPPHRTPKWGSSISPATSSHSPTYLLSFANLSLQFNRRKVWGESLLCIEKFYDRIDPLPALIEMMPMHLKEINEEFKNSSENKFSWGGKITRNDVYFGGESPEIKFTWEEMPKSNARSWPWLGLWSWLRDYM